MFEFPFSCIISVVYDEPYAFGGHLDKLYEREGTAKGNLLSLEWDATVDTCNRAHEQKGVRIMPGKRHGRLVSDAGKNILNRGFEVPERNRVWAGDIAYIPTEEGFLCLSAFLDRARETFA